MYRLGVTRLQAKMNKKNKKDDIIIMHGFLKPNFEYIYVQVWRYFFGWVKGECKSYLGVSVKSQGYTVSFLHIFYVLVNAVLTKRESLTWI